MEAVCESLLNDEATNMPPQTVQFPATCILLSVVPHSRVTCTVYTMY